MLNFKELPVDGVKFEQLIRELLLRAGLKPFWTGQGADGGRDLVAHEVLIGNLSEAQRTWLVDCKHMAHSGRATGVGDVVDIVDRCRRVGASGFLLATSTHPSSELSRKLDEIQANGLSTATWDAVDIERRLMTNMTLMIAQQFFPLSVTGDWRIFYTERERRWTAHYKGKFLYVESRTGIDPPNLLFLGEIVDELDRVPVAAHERVRVRAIWHDTPNGCFYTCWADYLVPADNVPTLDRFEFESVLRDNIDGQVVDWQIKLQLTLPHSDYFNVDDDAYYMQFVEPLYHKIYGIAPSDSSAEHPDWWKVYPPAIRSFNDAAMWNAVKELHGFKPGMTISPPYRKKQQTEI